MCVCVCVCVCVFGLRDNPVIQELSAVSRMEQNGYFKKAVIRLWVSRKKKTIRSQKTEQKYANIRKI